MHRSLQALQYYTSHSEEDIQRLHERIRSSLASTESLTDTMIRLTGQTPIVPFKQDTVTVEEWSAFLAGKHHDTLADFYGTLVARPILEEDGPVAPKEKEDIAPHLSRTHREPDVVPRKKVKIRSTRSKRRIPWGWLALLILCFLLGAGGTFVYSNYIASPTSTEPKSTIEKPMTVEKTETTDKKSDVKKSDAKEPANIVYVKTRNSNIYSDSSLTDVLYEADFGDGYRILETTDSVSKIELTEELTGYIKINETTNKLQEDSIADESLLTWVNDNLDTSFVTGTLIDLIGKTSEELNSTYGSPERTFADQVNTYLFYGNHFFTLQNNKVIAIDWSETAITNAELATLAPLQLETETTGLVTSNSYRLQRFEKAGTTFSRVRLTEQKL
ncbi:hypothetical protein QK289_14695 [Exiguobacterium antarcticum]|uniref:Uncharacterized protein n=1 Tax=Exiguobacterium antarcticum TaxID=132920 RepID=A0ABT6R5L9_9BACL|nr:hypothetical protein [Exiguobacterium antarcticum]MDI3236259.1 hypothetical protein [Exiguobacterium antarcticum]